MRVLVVATTFPQYDADPRGAFIRAHWEGRAAQGDVVRVLAPRSAWCHGELLSALDVRRFGYAPARLSTLTGNFGILENIRARPWRVALVPALWVAMRRAVRKQIDAFRPDLVVAHMLLPGGWIVADLCSVARVPFELYGHGTDVDVFLHLPAALHRRFERRLATARAVHFPSSDKRARFRTTLGSDPDPAPLHVESMVHVVPPPEAVDPEPRVRAAEVLYLGRLIRQKGVDDLLGAVALLPDAPVVHVAGDGPERRRLQRLARRLGVNARFHGFVSGERKEALLRRAGVLCVPSREVRGLSEGSPLVICEALVRGLPVVASSVGGIPELCRDAGLCAPIRLVPAASPRALSQALAQVLAPC